MVSGEMFFDEIQELSSDIGYDVVVEGWIKPYNVPFPILATLIRLFWFVFKLMVVARSFEGIVIVR